MTPLARIAGEFKGSPISNHRRAASPFCSMPWTANNRPSSRTTLELNWELGRKSSSTLVPFCVATGASGSGIMPTRRSAKFNDGFDIGGSIEVIFRELEKPKLVPAESVGSEPAN